MFQGLWIKPWRDLSSCEHSELSEDFRCSKDFGSNLGGTYRLANIPNYLRTSDLGDKDELPSPCNRSHIDTGDGPHCVSSSCGELA